MSEESVGEKMAALWGRKNLRPISAQMLDGLTLSDAERRLLTEYGLPTLWGGPLGVEPGSSVLGAGFVLDRQRAGAIYDNWDTLVNTNLARFAACLVLHRTLLTEGAALSRRFDLGDAPMPEPMEAEYRAAMVLLMDHIERELRGADPAAWKDVTGTHGDYYGDDDKRSYWPDMLGEYDSWAMWDAEDVYARWAGRDQCQT